MADFGQLTGARLQRAQARAAKFAGRIRRLIERAPDVAEVVGSRGQEAVVSAVSRFLASFGAETVRLNATSRKRLTQQSPAERTRLVDRAVEEIRAVSRAHLSDAVERFARGRIDQNQLRESMRQTLRRQTLAAAIVGVGGVGNLTENVLTAVRRALSRQFALLDGFISDLDTSGREVTNRDYARAELYANSANAVAQTAARQFALDRLGSDSEVVERRVLGGSEHCADCVELAALGWQPAGTLPAIGQGTVCAENCRCSFEVKEDDGEQVQDRQNPVPQAR